MIQVLLIGNEKKYPKKLKVKNIIEKIIKKC